jgi:hypothetical protein
MSNFQKIALENINTFIRSISPPSATTIHAIEKCFVDLNFQLNEDVNTFLPVRSVSFSDSSYNILEGGVGNISVSLNESSVLGIEELDLYFIGTNSQTATIGQDILFENNFIQPLRLSWSAGEQTKFIPFTALTDSFIESVEKFYFKLDHFTNCILGANLTTEINLVSISPAVIDLDLTISSVKDLGG